MKSYERRAVEWIAGSNATSADAWAFSPPRNFGCAGAARPFNEIYEDYQTATIWQPDVYAEAADLARAMEATEVVDFGCGSGEKLRHFFHGHARRLVGIDFKGSLALARRDPSSEVRWVGCNLGLWSDLTEAVQSLSPDGPKLLIASDVIEHLGDPRPLVGTLRQILLAHPGSRLLLSTPDRYRMHGSGSEAVPSNRCHVREWRCEELDTVLASSGFSVVRRGYTRSNLEDETLKTALVEVAATRESYEPCLRGFEPRAGTPSWPCLRLSGGSEDWDLLLQALFLIPDLPEALVPEGSEGERICRDGAMAGLLPAGLRINGRGAVGRSAGPPGEVSVLLVVRDVLLSSLTESVATLNSQSIDPAEVVVLVLGSRLDYRLSLSDHLRGALRPPSRFVYLREASLEAALNRVLPSIASAYLAVMSGGDLLLTDFLEVTTRFLANSKDVDAIATRAGCLPNGGLSSPHTLLPVVVRRPQGSDRTLSSLPRPSRRIPLVGSLVWPEGAELEPPVGALRALGRRSRRTLRRWIRG